MINLLPNRSVVSGSHEALHVLGGHETSQKQDLDLRGGDFRSLPDFKCLYFVFIVGSILCGVKNPQTRCSQTRFTADGMGAESQIRRKACCHCCSSSTMPLKSTPAYIWEMYIWLWYSIQKACSKHNRKSSKAGKWVIRGTRIERRNDKPRWSGYDGIYRNISWHADFVKCDASHYPLT